MWSTGWNFAARTRKAVNNYGYVTDIDFTPDHKASLGIIGDSFVEALQVANQEALPDLLQAASDNGRHVYGVGTSGAQLPTYLAYADFLRREFSPGAMAFVIIANDFDESACPTAMIRGYTWCFDMGGDLPTLTLKQQPPRSLLRRVLSGSALLRYVSFNLGIDLLQPFRASPAARDYVGNVPRTLPTARAATARASVDAFLAALPAKTGLPPSQVAFLVDGIRADIYSGSADGLGSFFDDMRRYFIATASRQGYEVVDLHAAFAADFARFGQRFEFPTDNHWNALGHWVAADALARSRVGGNALGHQLIVPRPGRGQP